MSKVLLVEDEADLASQIKLSLSREHYTVEIVDSGTAALDMLRVYQYDVIVLDWGLPGLNGIEVMRKFREKGGKTPILMLTARGSVDDRAEGLDSGADDYLPKPFHAKELVARLRALIRRASASTTTVLTVGPLKLDPVARKLEKDGVELKLEPKEFNLLEFLMRNANTVFSAEALIDRVWESDTLVSTDAIRTYIKGIRKKVDTDGEPSMIATVHGVGYRLDAK